MIPAGLVTVDSAFTADETIDRVRAAIEASGNAIFAVFDHTAAAASAGLTLRPTAVFAFGNPSGGTKLMQLNQTIGIDLPLKVLVWENEHENVKVSYNDPQWLSERHGLESEARAIVAAMSKLLGTITQKSTRQAA